MKTVPFEVEINSVIQLIEIKLAVAKFLAIMFSKLKFAFYFRRDSGVCLEEVFLIITIKHFD